MTRVWELYAECAAQEDKILNSDLNSTDEEYQAMAKQHMQSLAELWHTIEASGLFSSNEEVDDIPTNVLPCLRVLYFMGVAQQRIIGPKREDILVVARQHYMRFLALCAELRLIGEDDVEKGVRFNAMDRNGRLERGRARRQLEERIRELESKRTLQRKRYERLKQLGGIDGEMPEDADTEEVDRELAIANLKHSAAASYEDVQMLDRELDMLSQLTEEERRAIVGKYQEEIELQARGLGSHRNRNAPNQTVTILPGGVFVPGTMDQVKQQIKDEVFMNRNTPTQTLQEFAEGEMAQMQQDMDKMKAAQEAQQEEDDRLGEEGIEERERVKQTMWDDWRDDHPPIGKTTKGNYS